MFTFSFLSLVLCPTFSGNVALRCVCNNVVFRSSSDSYCREGFCPRTNTELTSRDIYSPFHLLPLWLDMSLLGQFYVLGWTTGPINTILIIYWLSGPHTYNIYIILKKFKINYYYKEMNNEFLIVTPHCPCMHHELSYYFICIKVCIFVWNFYRWWSKIKISAWAILFLEIQ